jgi:nitrogen fixation protein
MLETVMYIATKSLCERREEEEEEEELSSHKNRGGWCVSVRLKKGWQLGLQDKRNVSTLTLNLNRTLLAGIFFILPTSCLYK